MFGPKKEDIKSIVLEIVAEALRKGNNCDIGCWPTIGELKIDNINKKEIDRIYKAINAICSHLKIKIDTDSFNVVKHK